ncbi:hypothetical protein [Edwardsiella anguillarum]|uniref:hypothetical protein n=1 Tax=Edwardsiella anguillarum TaxID=1821960 RepID=UPI0024B6A5F7|nr:hypothetical protein [Edwardsiella anguillarum]WHQ15623.1 hypothetical protein MQ083_07625 [Edwardsiella anguillarum]
MDNYYLEQPLAPGEHDFAIIDRMQHPEISETWPVLELVSPMLKPQAHVSLAFALKRDESGGVENVNKRA